MNRFKRIIMPLQGKSKTLLHELYNRKFRIVHAGGSNKVLSEEEKIFSFLDLKFYFEGTNILNTEKLLMTVEIPSSQIKIKECEYVYSTVIETFMLRKLAYPINDLSKKYVNEAKSIREKAQFNTQEANENILRRNSLYYNEFIDSFLLRIEFNVPLVNAISINAKNTFKAVKELLILIRDIIDKLDTSELNKYIDTYKNELFIREYLIKNNYIAFIANGSILPRYNNTNEPIKNAVSFLSPKNLEITIDTGSTKIKGMGIKKGITIITGGGYSGKSTLLDALENGIYNHIPGDGREYVITITETSKIYAEDGRPVINEDISPFFNYLPNVDDLSSFSTTHSSGSVSQATNIIEAINSGVKVLLIDEDKSATNFMIRDHMMRIIVKKEPIIPFTDRIQELSRKGISTILVIGGSSEYLRYADLILLMEDYICKNITNDVKNSKQYLRDTNYHEEISEETTWIQKRYLVPKETTQKFLYFKSIKTENDKYIYLDNYNSNITFLTQIKNTYQIAFLASILESIILDKEAKVIELNVLVKQKLNNSFKENHFIDGTFLTNGEHNWYEEVRSIDIVFAINRMRGLIFVKDKYKNT